MGIRASETDVPPIVGSLFSWKSLLTNRSTKDDWRKCQQRGPTKTGSTWMRHTFPTAASPRSTSLTLLLGLGALESAMVSHARAVCGSCGIEGTVTRDRIDGQERDGMAMGASRGGCEGNVAALSGTDALS